MELTKDLENLNVEELSDDEKIEALIEITKDLIDPWKVQFINQFGWDEWNKLERRRQQILLKHLELLYKKYVETGNKTYKQIARKYGVDVD